MFNTKCEFKTMTSIKSLTLLFLLLAISMVSCTQYSNIPRQRQWFKTSDKSEKQTKVVNEINSKKEVKNEAIAVVELPSIIEPSKADYSSETTSKTIVEENMVESLLSIKVAKTGRTIREETKTGKIIKEESLSTKETESHSFIATN